MMAEKRQHEPAKPGDLDSLVHERLRLVILSALAVQDGMSFTELRATLGATDGNLSTQSRRLEEAGYVRCNKSFVKRRPKTVFRLTATGRQALENYLNVLERLLPPRESVTGEADSDGRAAAQPA
jgi:DNA-binding MarR family transcriptional regulator